MFDTMTLTKIVGGFCGSLLVLLLIQWGGELIYHEAEKHDGEHHQAYTIDPGEDEAAEEVVEVAFADVFAAADASKGERLFRQCSACHKVEDGANGAGPHLYGVVGRDVGAVSSFGGYSGALTEVADVWTPEALNGFLESPRSYAPGTSMSYNGMRDVEDRANLIAWLEGQGG